METLKYLLVLWGLCPVPAFAQTRVLFENFVERQLETLPAEIDHQAQLDQWSELFHHPININTCNSEQLISLGFLSPSKAQSVIEHRDRFGPFIDHLELYRCGLSSDEISWFMLFVKIPGNHLPATIQNRQEVILTHQLQWPQAEGTISGRDIVRYRALLKRGIRISFTAENDPGEAFFSPPNHSGFDFYSGNATFSDLSPFSKLILGDFQADFGQGLTIGNGFHSGKSSLVLNTLHNATGIKAYRSVDENNFMRGIGAQLEFDGKPLYVFASRLGVDANILSDSLAQFSSFQSSGIHKTTAEIEDKDALQVTQIGGHFQNRYDKLTIGQTINYVRYSKAYHPDSALYRLHQFEGNQFLKAGMDFSLYVKTMLLFGEASYSSNNKTAWLLGSLYSLGRKADLTLVYRYFAPGFIAFQSGTFSERSVPENETGIFAGLKLNPAKTWSISTYADFYRFPWLRFDVSKPSSGSDQMIEIQHNPTKKLSVYVRYKSEQKEVVEKNTVTQRRILQQHTNNLRFHLTYFPASAVRLQTRFEVSGFSLIKGTALGQLIYQDITVKPKGAKWKVSYRTTMSKVNDFDHRIYAYENDVPNAYSIPFYSKDIIRNNFLFSLKVKKHLTFWVRFAHDFNFGDDGFGSGREKISGNRRSSLKLQLKVQF